MYWPGKGSVTRQPSRAVADVPWVSPRTRTPHTAHAGFGQRQLVRYANLRSAL